MMDTSVQLCCEPNHCWERRSVSLPFIEPMERRRRRGSSYCHWSEEEEEEESSGPWWELLFVGSTSIQLHSDTDNCPVSSPVPRWLRHLLLLHAEHRVPRAAVRTVSSCRTPERFEWNCRMKQFLQKPWEASQDFFLLIHSLIFFCVYDLCPGGQQKNSFLTCPSGLP